MSQVYLTTPIYYVNDLPHIGHIYTTVVADALARYRRLAGDEVHFLTGTDEHGQNIERAARERGLAPTELADQVVSRYHALWRELAISHDDFIRTTEPRHRRGVEAIIARLEAAGDLYTARHEGWYCSSCEAFYTEKELDAERRCPVHERPAEWGAEENVFFRLSRFQRPLLEHLDRHPGFVRPETRANEVRAFVESGLRDLSVSRTTFGWGVPFPGHDGHVVYVWLDALTNYVSALGLGDPEGEGRTGLYRRFWSGQGERIHLIGKDILRFHAVYWPAFLLSAGLPLPTTVWVHGWWTSDGRKISKSVGKAARPDHLIADFGADPLRFFLLREMTFGQDASFSEEAFVDSFNSHLANDLGNTLSRLVTLSRSAFDGRTPPVRCDSNPLIAAAEQAVRQYRTAMDEPAFQRALEALWRLLAEANGYLVAREPWRLLKSEGGSESVSRILWNGLEALRIVGCCLLPVMPRLAPRLLAALGVDPPPTSLDALAWGGLATGREIPEPAPLFPRIDRGPYLERIRSAAQTEAAAAAAPPGHDAPPAPAGPGAAAGPAAPPEPAPISIAQFGGVGLRVATVLAAEAIPKSSKLLRLSVDLGGETRTVVAGIAKEYRPEELVGRQVVVVANLEPATLMGVESRGMVLAASVEGRPVLLRPDREVPAGTGVK